MGVEIMTVYRNERSMSDSLGGCLPCVNRYTRSSFEAEDVVQGLCKYFLKFILFATIAHWMLG
ncbi:MAG: hypothetical protein R2822_15690 [Spirosomataceae bacterium]